jgi:hypothetical protein
MRFATMFSNLARNHIDKRKTSYSDEYQRLSRLLNAPSSVSSFNAQQLVDLTAKHNMIRGFQHSIPKVVHFIKTDANPNNFHMVAFLAIRSASYQIRPTKIKFHCVEEPQGTFRFKSVLNWPTVFTLFILSVRHAVAKS